MNQFSIFAKYWQPGQVKTRLAEGVGIYLASEYSRLFLTVLARRFAAMADRRTIVYSPASAEHHFEPLAAGNWQLEPQAEGDLGERLQSHFDRAFQHGARRVVVIGSDSPSLPTEFVEQAWQQLNAENPVVLGRAEDGGYYLIGAYQATPPIFNNIAWSTHEVFQQTTHRLSESGIRFSLLPMWYDIDDVGDFHRFASELDDPRLSAQLEVAKQVFDEFGDAFLRPKLPWPPQNQ